jgi:hypothetical protein
LPLASVSTVNVPELVNVWIVLPPDVVIVPPVGAEIAVTSSTAATASVVELV